jgi:hypothetical protein
MSTASNKESVAKALGPDSGFSWESTEIGTIQSDSNSINFEDEWNIFSSLVASTVAVPSKSNTNTAVGKSLNEPTTPTTNSEALNKQATPTANVLAIKKRTSPTANRVALNKPTTPTASNVWENHFKNVISNPGTEDEFNCSLFEALRMSLRDFVLPIGKNGSGSNLIVLRSSLNVGFGKEVLRTNLGFTEKYGLSRNSKPDHGCYVFGRANEVYDVTAVVELKLDETSCNYFVYNKGKRSIEAPDFWSAHAPMGQAILYSMDVWHCLARRGISVNSVPVVILAGTKKLEDSKRSKLGTDMILKDPKKICCLEAHICIPEYCGEEFSYSVDRLISFDGTTGLSSDEALSTETAEASRNSRDKRAIAIYIRTMRLGLKLALEISKNRSANRSASCSIKPPVSLCCRQLLSTGNTAPLIASPIPYGNVFPEMSLSVKQGEFFQKTMPTVEDFSGFSSWKWFFNFKVKVDDVLIDAKLPENCLVKVSCVAVHNTSVNRVFCKEALKELHGSSAELRREVSKVLLGFCHTGESGTLITLMKDLRMGEKKFQMLEHQKYRQLGKLSQLWLAFCVLVKSLLLPMANENIIHLDIRSTATFTYNILVSDPNDEDICELRLIDYDSLVFDFSSSGTEQDGAIYWKDLKHTVVTVEGIVKKSAHRYLLWQVLWIAYRWHTPPSAFAAPGTLPEELTASTFLCSLFEDNHYMDFKNWLGTTTVTAIREALETKTITAKEITETLDCLGRAFSENV